MLASWIEEEGNTVEEKRAALAQIVDRVEFDPDTGEGRVHYRVPFTGGKFRAATAAREIDRLGDLGIAPKSRTGVRVASPRLPELIPKLAACTLLRVITR